MIGLHKLERVCYHSTSYPFTSMNLFSIVVCKQSNRQTHYSRYYHHFHINNNSVPSPLSLYISSNTISIVSSPRFHQPQTLTNFPPHFFIRSRLKIDSTAASMSLFTRTKLNYNCHHFSLCCGIGHLYSIDMVLPQSNPANSKCDPI